MNNSVTCTSGASLTQGVGPLSACTVCGSAALEPSWRIGAYGLARCARCTHLFVSTGLAAGELDHSYESDYYLSDGSETRTGYKDYLANAERRLQGFRQRLHELERHISGRGSALDFGCAVGLFVKVAAEAGWDAVGVERSVWAADYGRKHYGLNIVSGSEVDCESFNQRFDLITMWDVLEHLEDPRDVLEKAARWLKPGGVLALNTVEAASLGARMAGVHWRHLAPPHHLQYFTRQSLKHLLTAVGFRFLEVRGRGVMWKADRRREHIGGIRALSEAAATHWRTRPIADALHLLDEIDVVAVHHADSTNG